MEMQNPPKQPAGFVFLCNGRTKPHCYQYRVFGVPASQKETVERIKPGTKLFLFDYELKLLYGVYGAVSEGGMNLEPAAFNGRFPAQIRFAIFMECVPLPENHIRGAIQDNYIGLKFRQELDENQVASLISLFSPITAASSIQKPLLPKNASPLRKLSSGTNHENRHPASSYDRHGASDPTVTQNAHAQAMLPSSLYPYLHAKKPAHDQQTIQPAQNQQIKQPAQNQQILRPAQNRQIKQPTQNQQIVQRAQDKQTMRPVLTQAAQTSRRMEPPTSLPAQHSLQAIRGKHYPTSTNSRQYTASQLAYFSGAPSPVMREPYPWLDRYRETQRMILGRNPFGPELLASAGVSLGSDAGNNGENAANGDRDTFMANFFFAKPLRGYPSSTLQWPEGNGPHGNGS